jgi:hypothetical protein
MGADDLLSGRYRRKGLFNNDNNSFLFWIPACAGMTAFFACFRAFRG